MESTVASYAEGVAQALVGKLGQLVSEEFRLLGGVRGEVGRLRDEVAIVNALLRQHSEADESTVDHFVREWMNQVRELAYDAEDCIDLFLLRISYAPPRAGKLGRAWRWLLTICPRHRLAVDIQDLHARALAISERRVRYSLDGQALHPAVWFVPGASATVSSATHALRRPSQLVGIEDQVQRLSEKLTSDDQSDGSLKVFSIVGFGGLGKTTLAKEVCRSLEENFDCQAFVPVCQAFDAGKDISALLKRVLDQVVVRVKKNRQSDLQEVEDGDGRGEETDEDRLTRHLQDKRYLIVIDDVWTISTWEAILARLPANRCSSRIIVTTRIEHVARACSPASPGEDYIHRVKPLQLQYAKELFVDTVFGPQQHCSEQLAEIMDKILARCCGLPLAIVCIGRLLANYTSPGGIEMWTSVCNLIGSHMESNPTLDGMRQIITLSYNHLPHHLKACMMYLSIFPEDYVIDKDRLMNRWFAERLVSEKRGLTLREVAQRYFDELLSRNMIEPFYVEHDGTVKEYRVHDMMLEVIVSKAVESNFVTFVVGQCRGMPYGSVRRLSVQSDDLGSGIENANLRNVRSLSTFRPQGHRYLLDRLNEFTLLRMLDLQDCKDLHNQHMKHVCRLFLLRFLGLNGTDITELPNQINRLQHLQTLWLYDVLLDNVPESLVDLEKLERVSFKNMRNDRKFLRIPRDIKKMKALQELTRFVLFKDDDQLAEEIGDLIQLRHFNVFLHFSNGSQAQVLTKLARSICRLCSLHILCVEDLQFKAGNMNFLLELPSPPKFLRELHIGGTIDRIPSWVQSLNHLVLIGLWWSNLTSDEIYGTLYKLPSLSKITLDNCCSDNELVARTVFKFPVLKELTFVPDVSKPQVVRFEEGAMPNLETILLDYKHHTVRIPERILEGVKHLTSLKVVRIQGKKSNGAIRTVVDQLKAENIQVIVTYK